MGPFELIDLIGLDVNLAVSRSIHTAYAADPRYTPSLLLQELVEAGRPGASAAAASMTMPPTPSGRSRARRRPRRRRSASWSRATWPRGAAGRALAQGRHRGRPALGRGFVRIGKVRLTLTDGRGATEWSYLLQAPVILFDLALDFATCPHIAMARAEQASDGDLAQAVGLMQAAGLTVPVIDDFPGMLVMRTVCMLANEAADVVHTGWRAPRRSIRRCVLASTIRADRSPGRRRSGSSGCATCSTIWRAPTARTATARLGCCAARRWRSSRSMVLTRTPSRQRCGRHVRA